MKTCAVFEVFHENSQPRDCGRTKKQMSASWMATALKSVSCHFLVAVFLHLLRRLPALQKRWTSNSRDKNRTFSSLRGKARYLRTQFSEEDKSKATLVVAGRPAETAPSNNETRRSGCAHISKHPRLPEALGCVGTKNYSSLLMAECYFCRRAITRTLAWFVSYPRVSLPFDHSLRKFVIFSAPPALLCPNLELLLVVTVGLPTRA